MAIRKVTEGVSQWNSKMPFPKDRYVIHCLDETFGISKSSGNPMLTREFEIVAPETVQVGDRTISLAGAKITQYRPTKVKAQNGEGWDTAKSDKRFGELRDELVNCGFASEEIDDENPPIFMKGKTFEAIVYAKEERSRKAQTPEQRAKGEPGEPIKDASGKEVVTYQLQIEVILGQSTTKIDAAF